MPAWSLNVLLEFLDSPLFEPLSSASPIRLLQKTLCLLLLATGRRVGEVSHLSRSFLKQRDHLVLSLLPSFLPKHHTPGFMSSPPCIGFFDKSLLAHPCPARAFLTYIRVSSSWSVVSSQGHNNLWFLPKSRGPLSVRRVTKLFSSLVEDCRLFYGLSIDLSIGPHQMRKLAASYAHLVGQDEDTVKDNMGFSSVSTLRKHYVGDVPPLRLPCVLPGGPFFPEPSSSDSD